MHIRLVKSFDFQGAHWLPTFPPDHKCRRLHGHSFRVDVVVEGPVPEDRGYLIDYGDITKVIGPIRDRLDHHLLNEIEGLGNPTAEILARWIFEHLRPQLPLLTEVRVHETCTNEAAYRSSDL